MEQPEKNCFSYEKFNDLTMPLAGFQNDDGTYNCYLKRDFVWISSRQENTQPPCKEGEIFMQYGLKFHISLPEDDKDKGEDSNYSKGWNIICSILMKRKICGFKIIKPFEKMSEGKDNTQRGKDITIYADMNPEKSVEDWNIILTEITQELVLNQIPLGYRPPGTSKKKEGYLEGSNYVCYRYYNESTKKSVWPKFDSCKGMRINVQNQLEIPKWNSTKMSEKELHIVQMFK